MASTPPVLIAPVPPSNLPPPQARAWRANAVQALRSLLFVLALATGISALAALLSRQSFVPTWIYTVCITGGCWTAIRFGLELAMRWFGEGRPGWPTLPWTLVVVVVGTVLGYTVGNELGNLITGLRVPSLLSGVSRQVLVPLLVALVPGGALTWYYYTRERLAQAEAQAQAAQRAAAENQLRLLESQLEPHMLFNTLANLRVLIGIDPPRAQAMLDQLISFLRATLAASRAGQHALADEFARIADYLALMQVRMGPRLQVQLDLPEDLRALPVPPLLLQPLVENSIRHGLEPQVAGGALRVAARREGDTLRLTVRDTGVGLTAAAVDGAAGSRFGLEQVRARLAALHGASASLTLAPAADAEGGTLAEITLPWPSAPAAPAEAR
jgi:signal transduction histidine kinase